MTRSSLGRAAALALALTAPGRASAQSAPSPTHIRVAGCYAVEGVPWPDGVARRIRLTLEPVEGGEPSVPQFQVRPAAGERDDAGRYPYRMWSLYADGHVVSIVWSSDRDQIGLTFEPDPDRPGAPSAGSATFFRHDRMETSAPVEVSVRSITC